MNEILKIKRDNSADRVAQLQLALRDTVELSELPNLSIFVAGSYARQEASIHSDIDLFFILNGDLHNIQNHKTKTLRAFSRIIEESDRLKFPAFSNDGEFLKVLEKPKIQLELGGRQDGHLNYFTARMLLLLESKPIYGELSYDLILRDIVGTYFRDYTHHPKDFKPIFLINDILRFWKTLCLNYENKRNQPETDADQAIKQKIKNFKLRFSRMMTCFGSIVAIIDADPKSGPQEIIELCSKSPFDRFQTAALKRQNLHSSLTDLRTQYAWFLDQTNVSGEELLDRFRDKAYRTEAFEKADVFGDTVFGITHEIAAETGYLRYLLI